MNGLVRTLHFQLHQTSLRIGGSAPLRDGEHREKVSIGIPDTTQPPLPAGKKESVAGSLADHRLKWSKSSCQFAAGGPRHKSQLSSISDSSKIVTSGVVIARMNRKIL